MSSTTTTQAAPVVRRVRVRDLPVEQQRAIRARQLRRAGTYVLAITIAVWIMLPIWLVGTLAFSTPADVRAYPKQAAPIPFSTDTMEFFLNARGVLPATRNSIVVALLTLTLSTAIAAPAGYAVARYFFRGRDAYRLGILAVRAFPIVILAVPLAVTFRDWGIFDRVYSVALMHTALTLPTTVLVIGSVFASIPYELEEAAQVYGCTPLQAFRAVVLPLVAPGIAASAIFTFVMSWNEVFAASILTVRNRTLPAQVLSTLNQSSEPYQFAGAFFMMIPALIFIFIIRRYLFNMWGQISK